MMVPTSVAGPSFVDPLGEKAIVRRRHHRHTLPAVEGALEAVGRLEAPFEHAGAVHQNRQLLRVLSHAPD